MSQSLAAHFSTRQFRSNFIREHRQSYSALKRSADNGTLKVFHQGKGSIQKFTDRAQLEKYGKAIEKLATLYNKARKDGKSDATNDRALERQMQNVDRLGRSLLANSIY